MIPSGMVTSPMNCILLQVRNVFKNPAGVAVDVGVVVGVEVGVKVEVAVAVG